MHRKDIDTEMEILKGLTFPLQRWDNVQVKSNFPPANPPDSGTVDYLLPR